MSALRPAAKEAYPSATFSIPPGTVANRAVASFVSPLATVASYDLVSAVPAWLLSPPPMKQRKSLISFP
ncbi:hypothetical protein BRC81_14485 [Halobacteriales archaeon QS_1_68_20]|nr:MAG: hypothetical protein BRC81_14485 [Halobacteriales archaeon QS_1_68_20]